MAWLNDHKSASDHCLIETTNSQATRIRAELENLKRLVRAKCLNSTFKKTKSKKRPASSSYISRSRTSHIQKLDHLKGKSVYLLFEFASGYALFYPHGVGDLDMSNFESHEKYIKCPDQVFTLKAFLPFSSTNDALVQMNAIYDSMVTEELKSFLLNNLPKLIDGKSDYYVATHDPLLGHNILIATRMSIRSGLLYTNVMRGIRMGIEDFIGDLNPGQLKKTQVNLARFYSKQRCTAMYVENSTAVCSSLQVVVMPHKFEGLFIAKGIEENICTKNLVYGEAFNGEEQIFSHIEDGIEVEYRVWNPRISKLAAAIVCGVTNIRVEPGSRVLYLGDVCGITLSQLSDLVGLDGLVYAVGLSNAIVNMAEKRSNIITIYEKPCQYWKYRMVVGMVDVVFADITHSHEVDYVANNARLYLRAGGHYMITTQNNINSTSQDPFAAHHRQREFKLIELVPLEPIEGAYVMAVGGFRMLEK